MEPHPSSPPTDPALTPPPRPAIPVSSGTTKLERIADHSKSLADEVKTWVDLKLTYTKLEVQDEIQAKLDEVRKTVMEQVMEAVRAFSEEYAVSVAMALSAAVLALTGLTFLFVTLALGIGALLGAMWAGFLIVAVLLFVIAGVLGFMLKRRFDKGETGSDDSEPSDAASKAKDENRRLAEGEMSDVPRERRLEPRVEGVPPELAERPPQPVVVPTR